MTIVDVSYHVYALYFLLSNCKKTFKLLEFPIVPDKGYLRNALCTLHNISTLLS